jgi:hypothetical protein
MSSQAQPAAVRPLTAGVFIDFVWESAWEACIRAFLVLLLGGIAVGIVGDIFKDMIPSAPPGFGSKPQPEAETSDNPHPAQTTHSNWSSIRQHQFVIVAGIFFVAGMWKRLRPPQISPGGAPTRGEKVFARLSENWFGLIVGNAFGAMITAMVVVLVQQFSFSQMIWHWLLENVLSIFQPLAHFVLGNTGSDYVQRCFDWYDDNQYKFTFWFLYIAAIGDDLGLPNFKTLARYVWRRFQRRSKTQRPGTPQPGCGGSGCG